MWGPVYYNFKRYLDTYDYTRTGGNIALIKPLTDTVKGTVKYRLENVDVEQHSPDCQHIHQGTGRHDPDEQYDIRS